LSGRIVFDLTSAARWNGPPVGIVRAQRELARWARARRPDVVFALFDPRGMDYRSVSDAHAAAFIAGEASLNAWNLPDATGARVRRSARLPGWLSNLLQLRRTLLRWLERLRLAEGRPWLSRLADVAQRPLISARHRPPMVNPDGTRRAFLTPDMALGPRVDLGAGDTLVCAGFGWSHSNIGAIAAAKARAGFRFVVLCYDIIPIVLPQVFKPRDVAENRRYWDRALAVADQVVVNARAVEDDLRRHAQAIRVEPPPIAVCPLGANPAAMDAPTAAPLPDGLEPGRYALFVSTIEPRKGHEMLYRVWLRLLAEGVAQAARFKLVFVGRPGWMVDELTAALAGDARLAGTLLRLEAVSDAALDALYRQAAFCLYPSLYEGYGLPVVEAFARGKALIASDGGSLPEIVGDLSPVLPARDEDAWFETLRRWIEEPAARAPYEAAIRARFAHPTWEEAGARFFAAIDEALAGRPRG
jgi:glycosyltransferase involved in cell wall biosynthesis